MHRCLQVPEIFLNVLDQLDVDKNYGKCYLLKLENGRHYFVYPPCKSDCLTLALTCNQFLEPALNALWVHLTSIRPLLAILLNVKYADWEKELGNMNITFPPRVEHFQIDRFAFYARRIRALCVGSSEDMTPSVCRILGTTRFFPFRPIFPKLLCLEWTVDEVTILPYITLFVGPSLQALTIFPVTWSSVFDEFIFHSLSIVATSCPRLEILLIDDSYCEDEDSGQQTTLVLSALPSSLARVDIATSVSNNALLCLAEMPQLRSLTIHFYHQESEASWTSILPTGPSFPMLQKIKFEWGEVLDYARFFNSFHGRRNIRKISLDSVEYPSAPQFDTLVKSIAESCSPTSLKVFSLCTTSGDIGQEEPLSLFTINSKSFSPFVAFRNMESFDVRVYESHWDDELLEAFAKAWPNLRRLSLDCNRQHPSTFTLHGLYPLAKSCRHLEFLGLHLSLLNIDAGKLCKRDWDKPSVAHEIEIKLYHPRPDLDEDVVSYLADIFPVSDTDGLRL